MLKLLRYAKLCTTIAGFDQHRYGSCLSNRLMGHKSQNHKLIQSNINLKLIIHEYHDCNVMIASYCISSVTNTVAMILSAIFSIPWIHLWSMINTHLWIHSMISSFLLFVHRSSDDKNKFNGWHWYSKFEVGIKTRNKRKIIHEIHLYVDDQAHKCSDNVLDMFSDFLVYFICLIFMHSFYLF